MSEQQFVLKFSSQENEYFIRDNFEEDEELGSYTLEWGVRKLNELETKCHKLEKENEQLKEEYKIAINEMVTDYKKLEKENEQLREKSTEKFWNVLTGFCEYVVTDERRIKQLKYDFRPLVLSYWITITDGSDE